MFNLSNLRVGTGFDSHRFVAGRPLILGGVNIPHPLGLAAHSDGDVLAHAITDALLGGAGSSDIGELFPPDDIQHSNADSLELLAEVNRKLRSEGWQIINIDAVVVCENPKVAPHKVEIKEKLGCALQISPTLINIKGKTAERMGAIGRNEGIAVLASCLLYLDCTPKTELN